MKSVIGDLTSETIGIIFKECEKGKNKRRIETITNNIINIAFDNIKPYLYTIMAILILISVTAPILFLTSKQTWC